MLFGLKTSWLLPAVSSDPVTQFCAHGAANAGETARAGLRRRHRLGLGTRWR